MKTTTIKSTARRFQTIGFSLALVLGISGAPVAAESDPPLAPAAVDGPKPVTSKLDYKAVSVVSSNGEEGSMDTIITRKGEEIARIPNSRPVSFSPDGGILLLSEAAADDDCRHFLHNVAAGEQPKRMGQRKRIGGRYVEKAIWSEDGKSITFIYNKKLSKNENEIITVADHLVKDPAGKP